LVFIFFFRKERTFNKFNKGKYDPDETISGLDRFFKKTKTTPQIYFITAPEEKVLIICP
jgi:hypothetical protein